MKIHLPTLDELNKLSASQNILLILRGLYTSDLSFMYMTLSRDSIVDICSTFTSLVNIEIGQECHNLTHEELVEIKHIIAEMCVE